MIWQTSRVHPLRTTWTAPRRSCSNAVDDADGQTAATGSVDTDEGNGTLYWVVTQSATSPTRAQVKAGQDHLGAAADDDGSQSVSGTGTQTLSPAPSGLTAATAYFIHYMHEDAIGNQSAVLTANGFTTASAGGSTTAFAASATTGLSGTSTVNTFRHATARGHR